MATSTSEVRRSVVWLDLERRYLGPPKSSSARPHTLTSMTASTTTDLESPTSSRYSTSFFGSGTEREIPKSPLPWFDLRSEGSVAGTEKEEERTSGYGASPDFREDSIYDAYFVGPDPEQSISSRSMGSATEALEIAAGYEKPDVVHSTIHSETTRSFVKDESVVAIDEYPSGFKFFVIVVSLAMNTFSIALDRMVVLTIIPTISNDFQSFADASWYSSSYFLAAAVLQPTWFKIFQIFHIKRLYIVLMLLFTIGLLISALAPNSPVFILGRSIAGFAASGVSAGSLSIVAHCLPARHRTCITATFGGLYGIAIFVAPIIGGAFTVSSLTWRWSFYVNIPASVVATLVILLLLNSPHQQPVTQQTLLQQLGQLDWMGPLAFIPAMLFLLIALQQGNTIRAWTSPLVLSFLIISPILFYVWLLTQHRQGAGASIPFNILIQRTILSSCLFSFFSSASFVLIAYYTPLYFQAIRGSGALQSAINILPFLLSATIASFTVSLIAGFVGYVTPFMIFGMVLGMVGAGLITTWTVNTPIAILIVSQIIAGVGIGMNFQSPLLAVRTVSSSKDIAITTSLTQFFQYVGAGFSLILTQTILLNELLPQLQSIPPFLTSDAAIQAGATGLLALVPENVSQVVDVYASSLDTAFIVGIVVTGGALLSALGVEWKSIRGVRSEGNEKTGAS